MSHSIWVTASLPAGDTALKERVGVSRAGCEAAQEPLAAASGADGPRLLSPACPAWGQELGAGSCPPRGHTAPGGPPVLWGGAAADLGWRTQKPLLESRVHHLPHLGVYFSRIEIKKPPFFEIVTKGYIPYQLRPLTAH